MPLPDPLAICLEDLDAAADDKRYLRCVALPGGEPGLALDSRGTVRWMPDGPEACSYELWVSADGRLALFRNPHTPPVVVWRAGRSLEAPAQKPVMLVNQDLLEVDGRRLRVHLHGVAEQVHEPRWLTARALARMARAAAVALTLGTAVGGAGEARGTPAQRVTGDTGAIEVRLHPPAPRPRPGPEPKPPATRAMYCRIESMVARKAGSALYLKCPFKSRLKKGDVGQLLQRSGHKALEDGEVVVTHLLKDNRVEVRSKLKKLARGVRRVRFVVRR